MRIMIIGDLNGHLVPATKIAVTKGAKVIHAADITSSLNILCSGKSVEAILASAEIDIHSLVEQLKVQHICTAVVCCGIGDDPEIAVKAINAGAVDYLPLPPNEELIAAILENITKKDLDYEMIYHSEAMQNIMIIANKVAQSEANILITGSSGTGKELMARFIHQYSKHNDCDMISINCAAIPDNLLESEMFGHEKGAFTGATERRIGKFEEANNSTIFLDEISEMDLKMQSKLLRVLQEKEITRIGSNNNIKLNIRVIASSNRDLEHEVKNGNFREDLFYRLNVINIALPDLKDRTEDIGDLANYFIKKYAKLNGVENKNLSQNALEQMKSYSWPGNIRQLENSIHRGLLIASGTEIEFKDLGIKQESKNDKIDTLENIEKNAILRAMNVHGKDCGKIATVLGVSIKLLQHKIKKYKLEQ